VKFAINDKSRFNLDEIVNALSPRYRQNLTVVSGPDDKAAPPADKAAAPDDKAAPAADKAALPADKATPPDDRAAPRAD
jgi:hypothetical protein